MAALWSLHFMASRATSFVVAALFVVSPFAAAPSALEAKSMWQHTTQSWASGVVVPDGAWLAGEGQVSWADVKNLTAMARLPNITEPQGVTYIVLSAEGDDGAVIQVAAGVWPGSSTWLVYSWRVSGIGTGSPSYSWVMNASTPSMMPEDLVSVSISAGEGFWGMKVHDLNTGGTRTEYVPSPALTGFKSGDQEVFALESYTRDVSTFREMGNASLLSLSLNGRRVTSGWYAYEGWDPTHSPLFAVGSASPPTFITLTQGKGGQVDWSYDAQWTGAVWNPSIGPDVLPLAILAVLVPLAFILGRVLGRKKKEGSG
jgi:hypothetical protein